MTTTENFTEFYANVAGFKLDHQYDIVKMILYTVPEVKNGWKEFKPNADINTFDTYKSLTLQEHKFLNFILSGGLNDEQMKKVLTESKLIVGKINEAYAYTDEELEYHSRVEAEREIWSNTPDENIDVPLRIDKDGNAVPVHMNKKEAKEWLNALPTSIKKYPVDSTPRLTHEEITERLKLLSSQSRKHG